MKSLPLYAILWIALLLNPAYGKKPSNWDITPEESHINFTAMQKGLPVEGKFTHFTGIIKFDKRLLRKSSIDINIDLRHISTEYPQTANELLKPEWLFTEEGPRAYFKSRDIRFIKDNYYEAHGALTLRQVTIPFLLPFTLDIQDTGTEHVASVKAKATMQRLTFGVGQGEWTATDTIADDVIIDIDLKATTPYK